MNFQPPSTFSPRNLSMGSDRNNHPQTPHLPPPQSEPPSLRQKSPLSIFGTRTSQTAPRRPLKRRPIPESEQPKWREYPLPTEETNSRLDETDPLGNKRVRVAERKEIARKPGKGRKDEQPKEVMGQAGPSQRPATEARDVYRSQMDSHDWIREPTSSRLAWGKDEEQIESKEVPGLRKDAGENETRCLLDKYCGGQPSDITPPELIEELRAIDQQWNLQKSRQPRSSGPAPLGSFQRSNAELKVPQLSLPHRPKSSTSTSPKNGVNIFGADLLDTGAVVNRNQANALMRSMSFHQALRGQEEILRRYYGAQYEALPSQGVQKRTTSLSKAREVKRTREDLASLPKKDPIDFGHPGPSLPLSPSEQASKLEREIREEEERGEKGINESKGLFWGRAAVPESIASKTQGKKIVSQPPQNVAELPSGNEDRYWSDKPLKAEESVERKVEQRLPTPDFWSSTTRTEPYGQFKIRKSLEGGLGDVDAAPGTMPRHNNPAEVRGFKSALQMLREVPPPAHRRLGVPSAKRPWTTVEEGCLMMGLEMVQGPYWSQILALFGRGGSHGEQLKDRTEAQLKDRARNLRLLFLENGTEIPSCLQAVLGHPIIRVPMAEMRLHAQEQMQEGLDDVLAGSGSMMKPRKRQEREKCMAVDELKQAAGASIGAATPDGDSMAGGPAVSNVIDALTKISPPSTAAGETVPANFDQFLARLETRNTAGLEGRGAGSRYSAPPIQCVPYPSLAKRTNQPPAGTETTEVCGEYEEVNFKDGETPEENVGEGEDWIVV